MNLPDTRLERLPLFPLADVYLFPGAIMPLHLFEPRYIALLKHSLEQADRALAIGCLVPGFEADYLGRPPVRPILGGGTILAARETPQQTWNIIVRGSDRLQLVEEHPPEHSFREIRVRRLPPPAPLTDEAHYRTLRLLVARIALAAPPAREAIDLVLGQAHDAATLVYLLAAHIIGDPQSRRAILEAGALDDQLSIASEAIGRLLLEVGTRGEGGGTLH